MADYREYSQPTGTQAAGAAGESGLRVWAKPVVRRFSLQQTLAGSGIFFDAGGTHTSATPT